MFPAPSDIAIVARLRRGEATACREVYELYQGHVLRYLRYLSRHQELAEDLFQDTWVQFARSSRTLQEDTRILPWLLTVARNRYRSHRRWAMLDWSRVFGTEDDLTRPTDPAMHTAARQELTQTRAVILGMPDEAREVILLAAEEDLSSEDAAQVLGIRPDAYRQRLARARKELMARLER